MMKSWLAVNRLLLACALLLVGCGVDDGPLWDVEYTVTTEDEQVELLMTTSDGEYVSIT